MSNVTTVFQGRNTSTGENIFFTSSDGLSFTLASNMSSTLTQDYIVTNFIEYNGSNWLLGGIIDDADPILYKSSDGSNWSTVSIVASNASFRSMAANTTAFIVVTNTNVFLRSTDLVTFTPVMNPPEPILSGSDFDVRASSSIFLAFNAPGTYTNLVANTLSNMLYVSTDGITWTENTQINSLLNSIQIQQSNDFIGLSDFKYNGRKWLGSAYVVPNNDTTLSKIYTLTSTDGISWALHSNIQSTIVLGERGTDIGVSDTLWVMGNTQTNIDSNSPFYSPNSIIYSSNGIDWTGVPITVGGYGFRLVERGIVWNGLRWVASGQDDNGSNYIVRSDDAINWVTNTEITNIVQAGNFSIQSLGTSFLNNPYTYEEALLAAVPSDPVDKAFYFAALTNNYINYSSSTAVSVSNNNLLNYYRNLVPSIPVDTPLFFLPTNSSRVVSQSVISSLSDGNYVLFPDNYSVTISGKTYAISGNSLVITTSGVPATIAPNGTFTVYNKTLRFLTAGSSGVTVVTATASNPPCFLEGTKILCLVDEKEQYITIESLTKGTLVKTLLEGYKPVTHLGYSKMTNSGLATRERNQMYVCTPEKYPTLTEPLYITGCHSILVHKLTDYQKEETLKVYGRLFDTEYKYRLEAYLDDRASPWSEKGECTVWHVALENDNETWNYGIYANGLLVESISKRAITASKTLTLV